MDIYILHRGGHLFLNPCVYVGVQILTQQRQNACFMYQFEEKNSQKIAMIQSGIKNKPRLINFALLLPVDAAGQEELRLDFEVIFL